MLMTMQTVTLSFGALDSCLPVSWDAVGLSSLSGLQVYSAGLDNNITVWDLRKGAESVTLKGHSDSITGLALDPDGTHLLSNAADNSLRVWDLRPYAPANRCEKIFTGHQHNYEKNLLRCSWSSDGSKVRSHDRLVVRQHFSHACHDIGKVWLGTSERLMRLLLCNLCCVMLLSLASVKL